MLEQIIIAGFGGQGVLSLGRMLAESGMAEDKAVTWLPSYGPEMRGGTSNCHVIISDGDIGSPLITKTDVLIVLNKPSLVKFERDVCAGGLVLINSSIIDVKAKREDVRAHYIPASDIANELGDARCANAVLLGAYLQLRPVFKMETIHDQLRYLFGNKKAASIALNEQAIERGMALMQ